MNLPHALQKAIVCLNNGLLVGVPTETVYGLAANACSEKAVLRIFEAKKRPSFDPLIVHFASFEAVKPYIDLSGFATEHLKELMQLAQAFWPGPLTILLPKSPLIPDVVTSGLPHVGVRVPAHGLMLELLNALDFPLAAPSANPFGYISPTSAEHVSAQLGEQVAFILDGGRCDIGLESTVLGLEHGEWTIFRKGGLSLEKLHTVLKNVRVHNHSSSNPKAPGMLKSHYAPRKHFDLLHREALLEKETYAPDVFFLLFEKNLPKQSTKQQYLLSPNANFSEAAQNLFAFMRLLDALPACKSIVAEFVPDKDLGAAINDRLRRAAAQDEPKTNLSK